MWEGTSLNLRRHLPLYILPPQVRGKFLNTMKSPTFSFRFQSDFVILSTCYFCTMHIAIGELVIKQ